MNLLNQKKKTSNSFPDLLSDSIKYTRLVEVSTELQDKYLLVGNLLKEYISREESSPIDWNAKSPIILLNEIFYDLTQLNKQIKKLIYALSEKPKNKVYFTAQEKMVFEAYIGALDECIALVKSNWGICIFSYLN